VLAPRNPRVVRLGRLSRERKVRRAEGRFVIDGPTLLADALAAGVEVEECFVEPGALDREPVASAVAAATAAGARVDEVRGGLGGHLDVATPNGVAAVAVVPEVSATSTGPALDLVLIGVADPGNAGTLLRTAEAVGARSVVLTDGSVDPFSPKVVRASAGSVMRMAVSSGAPAAVLARLGDEGVLRVGTRGSDGLPPEAVDLTGPVALVLGNEAHGLPADVEAMVEAWTALPMVGAVESLNVAVAGSVLAFEVARQRRSAVG